MKITVLFFAFAFNVSSCTVDREIMRPPAQNPEKPSEPNPPTGNTITIKVNNAAFTATLSDNASAKAFKTMLPITIQMSDLNGNEKYYYLSNPFPVSSSNIPRIESGDIMLYGSSTLVLFYESFSNSYSYTKIGKINNPSGLRAALGRANVTVKFELE